jgi:hypothetical protein
LRCGGGRSRRRPPQGRDHPSTRSPRNSPASRGATASNAMGMTSWCSAVPHWRLRAPSPVASVATSCACGSRRASGVAHDAITDAEVTWAYLLGSGVTQQALTISPEMLAGYGTTDTLCPRCVPSFNLLSLCVPANGQLFLCFRFYVVSPLGLEPRTT